MSIAKLCSILLQNGISKETLCTSFNTYLASNKLTEEMENEVVDVLNILSGFHNPYVVVNELGISMTKINPTISELIKLGDGIGGTKITGTKEEIHEALKQAFDISKSKSLQEYNAEFARVLNDTIMELF